MKPLKSALFYVFMPQGCLVEGKLQVGQNVVLGKY